MTSTCSSSFDERFFELCGLGSSGGKVRENLMIVFIQYFSVSLLVFKSNATHSSATDASRVICISVRVGFSDMALLPPLLAISPIELWAPTIEPLVGV